MDGRTFTVIYRNSGSFNFFYDVNPIPIGKCSPNTTKICQESSWYLERQRNVLSTGLYITWIEVADLDVHISISLGMSLKRAGRASMKRLLRVDEVKEVCQERSGWRFMISM